MKNHTLSLTCVDFVFILEHGVFTDLNSVQVTKQWK